jgi:hypothetical protein
MQAQDEKLARLVAELQRAVIGLEQHRHGLGRTPAPRPPSGRPSFTGR